jgi:hypothetical protein
MALDSEVAFPAPWCFFLRGRFRRSDSKTVGPSNAGLQLNLYHYYTHSSDR